MSRKKATRRAANQSKLRRKRSLFGYPLIVFLLLCAGVFLLMATFPSLADDVHVTARVSGAPVTDPAVITSPTDSVHFSSVPVTVQGTCPVNAAYVELFRNNVMAGAAICDGGNFQLASDLFPGGNSLVAHVFNLTDDEGPVSAAVNVVYDVPTSPAQVGQPEGGGSIATPTAPASLLMVRTQFVYKGYHLGDLVEWPIEINSGTPPYTARVDWGDNSHTVYNRQVAGAFTISHRYNTLPSKKSFTIKVVTTDQKGSQSFLQFFVIVTSSLTPAPAANIFSKPTPSLTTHNWLWLAWPAYGAITVMVISYWLGEREELLMLRNRGLLKHHH